MAPADADTPDYVSRAIGDFTRKSRSRSWQMGQLGGSSVQEREEGARLLRPEALRSLGENECVLLVQDSAPVRAWKVFYDRDRKLRRLFEQQSGNLPEPMAIHLKRTPVVKLTTVLSSEPIAVEAVGLVPESASAEDSTLNPVSMRMVKSEGGSSDIPPIAVTDDDKVDELNPAHVDLLARIQAVRERADASVN